MCDLRRIRKFLDKNTAISLSNALVSSRLDYCNSLLYGVPKKSLNKLQMVQNTLARIVTRSRRDASATAMLKSLHWLPIRSRIHFKINLFTYMALHNNQPKILRSLISVHTNPKNLRSVTTYTLKSGQFAGSYGTKCFEVYAPKVWNTLPASIQAATSVQSFRKQLKTYLFTHPPGPP